MRSGSAGPSGSAGHERTASLPTSRTGQRRPPACHLRKRASRMAAGDAGFPASDRHCVRCAMFRHAEAGACRVFCADRDNGVGAAGGEDFSGQFGTLPWPYRSPFGRRSGRKALCSEVSQRSTASGRRPARTDSRLAGRPSLHGHLLAAEGRARPWRHGRVAGGGPTRCCSVPGRGTMAGLAFLLTCRQPEPVATAPRDGHSGNAECTNAIGQAIAGCGARAGARRERQETMEATWSLAMALPREPGLDFCSQSV